MSDRLMLVTRRLSLTLVLGLLPMALGVLVGRGSAERSANLQEGASNDHSHSQSSSQTAESSHHSRLVREAAIRTQADFDQGISFPPMDDYLTTFEEGWEISSRLAGRLGLSRRERKTAQAAIDRSRATFEKLVKANLVPLDDSGTEFLIRPFMREGHSELARLQIELKTILSPEVGDELFKYFRWRPHLGAFGANEVKMRVLGSNQIQIIRRHSMTGKTITNYTCTEDELLKNEGFSLSNLLR